MTGTPEFWQLLANMGFPALFAVVLLFILERKLNGISKSLEKTATLLEIVCHKLNIAVPDNT